MPIEVFDYRRDVKNVFIAPTVRGRFLRMEPGEIGPRHSHDLGDELFLILHGQCEFEIEGDRAVLGPGQLCVARVNQLHEVRVVGDEPMSMFLTVTPHIEPTHTFWDEQGRKLPPVYGVATRAERLAGGESAASIADLTARLLQAAQALAEVATAHTGAQRTNTAQLSATLEEGGAQSKEALDAIWYDLAKVYEPLRQLESTWNELAARVSDHDAGS
ncbi:MAG: Mannose-6-phosphate isomerase [Thermomicrobiales bacterium]|nr:Mannose-6-phosphate isomerase [Thermomicrobiales bacterium]MEA2527018.1 Mannose-6-phosphate isomerase [Thermomicrobiales bacterium]